MQARWAWMPGLGCQPTSSLATADKTWVAKWAALSLPLCMWQYDLATGIRDGNGNGLSFLVINNGCSEEIEKGSKVEAKVHSYYKCHLFKYQDHWKGILFIFLLLKNWRNMSESLTSMITVQKARKQEVNWQLSVFPLHYTSENQALCDLPFVLFNAFIQFLKIHLKRVFKFTNH